MPPDVPSYYLTRTVSEWSEADIVAWIRGEKGLSREDDRVIKRLFSVIGPPGSGKTTFLQQMETQLNKEDDIIALYLNLSAEPDAKKGRASAEVNKQLCRLLAERAKAKFSDLKSPGCPKTSEGVYLLAPAVQLLCRRGCTVVLLIDQIEDTPSETWQVEIERSVIFPVLYSQRSEKDGRCARVIIGRREEQKIIDPLLKWEDVVGRLEDLEGGQQKEQIVLRLNDLDARKKAAFARLSEDVAPGREQLRDEKINRILDVVQSDRERILDLLAGQLTGSPWTNLNLLHQLLLNFEHEGFEISTDELRNVLAKYWQRAGLDGEEHKRLRETLVAMARGWGADAPKWDPENWTQVDYALLHNGGLVELLLHKLEPAFKAGVIMLVEITRRYRMDPTLIQLANGSHPAAGRAGGQS